MSWEYDGDEDAFWAYCKANEPPMDYDNPNLEQTESVYSSFFDELLETSMIKGYDNIITDYSKELAKVKDLISFKDEIFVLLFFNQYGEYLEDKYRYRYYKKVKEMNPEIYNMREGLFNINIHLTKSQAFSNFKEVYRKKISAIENVKKNLKWYLISDLTKNLSFIKSSNDILLMTLIIGSINYQCFTENYSTGEWEFENSGYGSFNIFSKMDLFTDMEFSKKNIFDKFTDHLITKDKSFYEQFSLTINKLRLSYELILKGEFPSSGKLDIKHNEKKIILSSGSFRADIEKAKSFFKENCIEITLFEANGIEPMFKLQLEDDLSLFSYDSEKMKEKLREEVLEIRSTFTYNQLENKAKKLCAKYLRGIPPLKYKFQFDENYYETGVEKFPWSDMTSIRSKY